MKMCFRWFGPGFDPIPLAHIRQIPGVRGVIGTLYDLPAGAPWPRDRVRALREQVEAAGLELSGIESVNVHDAIKAGLPERDRYIEAYIASLKALGEEDVDLVCYNFMPVFDWTRSDLAKPREDGATVLAYDQAAVDAVDPEAAFAAVEAASGGFTLPGWEPERLARVRELFELYREVDEERLLENLIYFAKAIMPTCARYGIRMAIHPDDPAWPVFGLPRIVTGGERMLRFLKAVDDPLNGVTLCSGSLGSRADADIPGIIASLAGRIHFAHLRNVRHTGPGRFEEAAHLSGDGSLEMYAIVKALYESGFDGAIRPDHGRMIWGERGMPGYGLYDRALGIAYLNGLWEAVEKEGRNGRSA